MMCFHQDNGWCAMIACSFINLIMLGKVLIGASSYIMLLHKLYRLSSHLVTFTLIGGQLADPHSLIGCYTNLMRLSIYLNTQLAPLFKLINMKWDLIELIILSDDGDWALWNSWSQFVRYVWGYERGRGVKLLDPKFKHIFDKLLS